MATQYWRGAHGALWGASCVVLPGQAYYVNDSTMQRSGVVQDFLKKMEELSITLSFGWILCERCVD
jgi:hypothetical protein